MLEDVNVEHLLDVSASIDQNSGVWDACYSFLNHLVWHKPRQTVLMPRIEGLSDDHHSKAKCLFQLSRVFQQTGNHGERKRLLNHTLKLDRQRGDDSQVARTLSLLADVNRLLGLHEEGIEQAREALAAYERIGDGMGQADCLIRLAWLLWGDNQPDAAEIVASRAINLLEGEGRDYLVTELHHGLGKIHYSKGGKENAIHHFNTALGIASSHNWHDAQFWIHFDMARLFRDEGQYGDANAHIEQAKSHACDDVYRLGRVMQQQADIWYSQHRFEDAKSEAVRALEIYEKTGATHDAKFCSVLLQKIEQAR